MRLYAQLRFMECYLCGKYCRKTAKASLPRAAKALSRSALAEPLFGLIRHFPPSTGFGGELVFVGPEAHQPGEIFAFLGLGAAPTGVGPARRRCISPQSHKKLSKKRNRPIARGDPGLPLPKANSGCVCPDDNPFN